MAGYSILVKGGNVVREKKAERLDILIREDRIADIGDFSDQSADLVIDASGKYVAPGFIDITNHSDTHWTLFNNPGQESLLSQGVTTIIGGNCGASLAPLVRGEDIEGIQKWANVREININWRRVSELFDELSRHPLGVNFGTLVGHGTLRRGIIGEGLREATHDEIIDMCLLLKESMAEGAFGLSTNLSSAHTRPAGRDEVLALLKTAGDEGGLSKHHLKDEGKNILPALAELIGLGRETKTKLQISHFKLIGRTAWGVSHEAVSLIDNARAEGVDISADIFPYTSTGSLLYELLPPWLLEGGKEKILITLQDKEKREEAKSFLESLTLHYDRITIASAIEDKNILGKTIMELARSSELAPEELILKMLEVNGLGVAIFNEAILEDNLLEIVAKDYVGISSDGEGLGLEDTRSINGLPHPRSFGAFTRALQLFGREKNLLSFEEIIYKMTELPAERLGLEERGKIERGYFADLVIFDPTRIASKADYKNPYIRSEGIDWVIVNGKVALKSGEISGLLAGRILKKK